MQNLQNETHQLSNFRPMEYSTSEILRFCMIIHISLRPMNLSENRLKEVSAPKYSYTTLFLIQIVIILIYLTSQGIYLIRDTLNLASNSNYSLFNHSTCLHSHKVKNVQTVPPHTTSALIYNCDHSRHVA